MPAEYEECKFIVINRKHLAGCDESTKEALGIAMGKYIRNVLARTGKDISANRYYVCNQDEAYAPAVIATILAGETLKGDHSPETRLADAVSKHGHEAVLKAINIILEENNK